MNKRLPADPFLPVPDRRRDLRRAALYPGVYVACALGLNVYGAGLGGARTALAALAGLGMGAAAGAGLVWTGLVWRARQGRWHVSRTFAALAVGVPAAAVAGLLLGGPPPSGRGAVIAAAGWTAAVVLLRLAVHVRAHRRDRSPA